jgi:hypothetical protein
MQIAGGGTMGSNHEMKHRRAGRRLGALLLPLALLLAACSGGGTEATSTAKSDASTTTTTAATDSTALCGLFEQLAAGGAGPNGQNEPTTAEGWTRRIATVREMVDVAPAEWTDEARTYLQMVKDREQLAADNGYVGVDDLPADVRTAFISSHASMQAEVNRLISFMGQECQAPASG